MSSISANRRQNHSRRSKYTSVACFECQRRKSKEKRHRRTDREPSTVVGETTQNTAPSGTSSSSSSSSAPSAIPHHPNHKVKDHEFKPMETEFTTFDYSNEPSTTPLAFNSQSATLSGDRLQQLELALKLISNISPHALGGSSSSWNLNPGLSAPIDASTIVPNPFILEVAERMPDNVSLPSLLAETRRLLGADPSTDQMYLSRPGRQLSPTMVQLPRMSDMRCLIDVCSQRLSMYLPKIEYDESKAILPVATNSNGMRNVLTESKDFLLFSQLYLTMTIGQCLLSQSSGQDVSQARSFYHQGLSLVNQVPPIPVHWLGLAKVHCLRAVYLLQADELQAAVQAISSSIQFAWQCKLNDQNAWTSCNPEERRSRKSLWWAIYHLERQISQKVGQPYSINDKDVAVHDPLSREQLALCQDVEVLPVGISQDELYLQMSVDISRLRGNIWDKFFRAGCKASNNDEEVELMGLRISDLHRSVPQVFQWCNSVLGNQDKNSEPDLQISRRMIIHTRYTVLQLLVRQSPMRTEQVSLEQARFCHVLVSELVEIITAFITNYTLPRIKSLAYFMSSTLVACFYHLARILRNPLCGAERPATTRTFWKAIETLKLLATTVETAQRALSVLQNHTLAVIDDQFVNNVETANFARPHGYENDAIPMTEQWPSLSPSSTGLAQYLAGYYPNTGAMDVTSPVVETTLNPANFGQVSTSSLANGTVDTGKPPCPYFYLPYIG
ncbi:unnamed protein product [Fusarium venenatum]|uniref:Xylanolytic transcriptional activator regulatory domain-containing protein n=1 Tax=Fusarium venenatum TaxID=56646 RepID=A0A2L2TUP7_9HYPO|nr:uncharacterized protein FVRRES_08013 [Fusarium venenatum]CEI67936.1 unnamed protein product [Fusarium venenatum]